MSVSAWEPDPTGRHQYRWWDGEKWTDQVANNGVQTTDPTSISETLSPPQTPPATRTFTGSTGGSIGEYVASPWARLGARLFDILIFIPPVFIVFLLFGPEEIEEDSSDGEGTLLVLTLIIWAVWCVYEVVMIATKGQTLGKMVAGIKVVRSTNHALPSWGQSFGRWGVPAVMGIIPFLSLLCYASLLWGGPLRRGWHDKASNTVIIKTR